MKKRNNEVLWQMLGESRQKLSHEESDAFAHFMLGAILRDSDIPDNVVLASRRQLDMVIKKSKGA